jgi:hypothetical protein
MFKSTSDRCFISGVTMKSLPRLWVHILPALILLPLAVIPPVSWGVVFWSVGAGALLLSGLRIVVFLIRVLWDLTDTGEADPDMGGILLSLLVVGVMILALCSLAFSQKDARRQALMVAARIQVDCNYLGNCPSGILDRHLPVKAKPEKLGWLMKFPLRYDPASNDRSFTLTLRLNYWRDLVIEGGAGKEMDWQVVRP